jgi:hypothetical protein
MDNTLAMLQQLIQGGQQQQQPTDPIQYLVQNHDKLNIDKIYQNSGNDGHEFEVSFKDPQQASLEANPATNFNPFAGNDIVAQLVKGAGSVGNSLFGQGMGGFNNPNAQPVNQFAGATGSAQFPQGGGAGGGWDANVQPNVQPPNPQAPNPQAPGVNPTITQTSQTPSTYQQVASTLLGRLLGVGGPKATGNYVGASSPFSLGGINAQGDYEDQGMLTKLAQLVSVSGGKPGTSASEATKVQEMAGTQPLQLGEMKKMLLNAGFDTTKLTQEGITTMATAIDKIYPSLSLPEKTAMALGHPPQRVKSLVEGLAGAAGIVSGAKTAREKAMGTLGSQIDTASLPQVSNKNQLMRVKPGTQYVYNGKVYIRS